MFEEPASLDAKTKVQNMHMASGIKDTYQMFFLDKLFKSYQKKRGREPKQAALDKELESLPDIITSPVWGITGGEFLSCLMTQWLICCYRIGLASGLSCQNFACCFIGLHQIFMAGSRTKPGQQ
jgi:hypothetical protein